MDPSPHTSHFVEANGVRLNYLDWGGEGETLVFVHGLSGSPHAFDAVAPVFTDTFRVVAYARRGHGRSSSPEDGSFDNETLTEDLRQFVESMGAERVSLVGFSMGGNEITRYAALYPDRVSKLVYLDAAYDWTDAQYRRARAALPQPEVEAPETGISPDVFGEWLLSDGWWKDLRPSDVLSSMVRDLTTESPQDTWRFVVDGDLTTTLLESLMGYQHEYSRITVPALSIHAMWYPEGVAGQDASPQALAAATEWIETLVGPWQRRSIERFESEMANAETLVFDRTDHEVHHQKRDAVVEAMRRFLGT